MPSGPRPSSYWKHPLHIHSIEVFQFPNCIECKYNKPLLFTVLIWSWWPLTSAGAGEGAPPVNSCMCQITELLLHIGPVLLSSRNLQSLSTCHLTVMSTKVVLLTENALFGSSSCSTENEGVQDCWELHLKAMEVPQHSLTPEQCRVLLNCMISWGLNSDCVIHNLILSNSSPCRIILKLRLDFSYLHWKSLLRKYSGQLSVNDKKGSSGETW